MPANKALLSAITKASDETLRFILAWPRSFAVEIRVDAEQELIRRYPCSDCGAPAGRVCSPEYGCTWTDRWA